ncbi:type 1 glutamine amidotransferase domain-containing protein [Pseudolysinimonas sp.]|uniref:type 1 glutamine amidotransferase domain-containing protein n=1 Tax=Pseudolysinimonas sp. TaxID=2680009 RepID=UPI003F811FC7
MAQLDGKRIAIVTSNSGVEEAELASPRQAVIDAGGEAVLLAPEAGEVRTLVHDEDPGESFTADRPVAGADPAEFDGLILPGGTLNADKLRLDEDAIAFVDAVIRAGKPVAAICHGPWALVESGRLVGKTLTSFPSLQTDIENAGAQWVDEEVHVDREDGWTLVTSRNPGDLDAFGRELVAAFGGAA